MKEISEFDLDKNPSQRFSIFVNLLWILNGYSFYRDYYFTKKRAIISKVTIIEKTSKLDKRDLMSPLMLEKLESKIRMYTLKRRFSFKLAWETKLNITTNKKMKYNNSAVRYDVRHAFISQALRHNCDYSTCFARLSSLKWKQNC